MTFIYFRSQILCIFSSKKSCEFFSGDRRSFLTVDKVSQGSIEDDCMCEYGVVSCSKNDFCTYIIEKKLTFLKCIKIFVKNQNRKRISTRCRHSIEVTALQIATRITKREMSSDYSTVALI